MKNGLQLVTVYQYWLINYKQYIIVRTKWFMYYAIVSNKCET